MPPIPSLNLLAKASMVCAWMRLTSSTNAAAIIHDSTDLEDYFFVDPVKNWADECMVSVIEKQYMLVHNIVEMPEVLNAIFLQSAVYKAMMGDTVSDDVAKVIGSRLQSLSKDSIALTALLPLGRNALEQIISAKTLLNAAGIQAAVKAYFNAWCTSARFGAAPKHCVFLFKTRHGLLGPLLSL